MSALALNGRSLSREILRAVASEVRGLARPPGLGVIRVGEDPASEVYVGRKEKVARKLGFHFEHHALPGDASREEILGRIRELNESPAVDGFLLQLPLPGGASHESFVEQILPEKDVDGLHPWNLGRLLTSQPGFRACTALGIMRLLEAHSIPLVGKRAVIVGRSQIVGQPLSLMMTQAHATVTVCHSRTRDLERHVRDAEILVVAVGRSGLIPGDWIREGASVIDVGINRAADGRLTGDVDHEGAAQRAAHLTPVPGGVGPMTIAMLMENTLRSRLHRGDSSGDDRPSLLG